MSNKYNISSLNGDDRRKREEQEDQERYTKMNMDVWRKMDSYDKVIYNKFYSLAWENRFHKTFIQGEYEGMSDAEVLLSLGFPESNIGDEPTAPPTPKPKPPSPVPQPAPQTVQAVEASVKQPHTETQGILYTDIRAENLIYFQFFNYLYPDKKKYIQFIRQKVSNFKRDLLSRKETDLIRSFYMYLDFTGGGTQKSFIAYKKRNTVELLADLNAE